MTEISPPAGFLTIQSSGPFTTVQDLGRGGFLASGFSPSGANGRFLEPGWPIFLVGNPQGEAGLGNDDRRDYRCFFKALQSFLLPVQI